MCAIKKAKSLLVGLFLVVIAACTVLCGCSTAAEEPEEEIMALGQQTETAVNVVMTNGTGESITNIAILPAGSTEEPQYLMNEELTLENDTPVALYQEPLENDGLFDVIIVMGETVYTLHNLSFQTLSDITVHVQDGVAYIETVIDGNVLNSLADEVDIKTAAEEAAAAEAAAAEAAAYNYNYSYSGGYAQSGDACQGAVVLR